ncbi:MAG: outer membrane beta-barrel protein, partial [Ferruginibacter sp.]
NYTIGFALQPAHIESNSFTSSKISYKQSFINFFPVARFVYNFAKGKSLTINYTGSTNQPTYQQSQPIADVSNLLNTIIGNPNLKPEFSNTISIPINYLDVIKGNGFFANFSTSFVKDKIINNVTRNNFGIQETRYLNTNGFYNINATYGITKSINKRKYVFNYGGSINYNNNISYLSSIKNNVNNWLVMQRFATDYKIKKWLETSAAVNFSLNDIKNSINTKSNSTVRNWFFSHSSKLYFKYDFIFSYDIEKYLYSGYSNNVASNPFLINSSLEKQFFKTKKASLKFQAFDILNQNVSISRVINSSTSSITDTKTNRLQRYFMVSIIYRINKFKGSANRRQSMQTMPGVQSEVRILNGQIGL